MMRSGKSSYLRSVCEEILSVPPTILVLRITVIFLLSKQFGSGISESYGIIVVLLSVIMLLSERVMTTRLVWILFFGIFAYTLVDKYYEIDNHKYLITYWALACATFCAGGASLHRMRFQARLLIGFTFAFAVYHKAASGEYWDGSFFHYTILEDSRFEIVARFVGGLSSNDVAYNDQLLKTLEAFPHYSRATLQSSESLQSFAILASWWTVVIELVIAVLFLWSDKKQSGIMLSFKNWSLLVFIWTTYAIAPVGRFALILSILGIAQSKHDRHKMAFLATFIAMYLLEIVPEVKDYLAERIAN